MNLLSFFNLWNFVNNLQREVPPIKAMHSIAKSQFICRLRSKSVTRCLLERIPMDLTQRPQGKMEISPVLTATHHKVYPGSIPPDTRSINSVVIRLFVACESYQPSGCFFCFPSLELVPG